ncbi:MAG: carboxypeptidase regulatory-like domain-containing protein [Planctomycetota bacterium]|nr:carboxypeptidase regulatory-like domain-containing protein [Planctomycetota bacterium]
MNRSKVRSGLEQLEARCPFAADTLQVGMVYLETDIGSDLQGDRFELTFSGGAEGSQLTSVLLDSNMEPSAFGVGDNIFDTIEFGTSGDKYGADHAFPFQIISSDGIGSVRAIVTDGSSLLRLEFVGFEAGDRLVFSIDVDEIEEFDLQETNPNRIQEGIDPITSGVEFQGTKLTAEFEAPNFYPASVNSVFRNRYDEALIATGLQLPADDFDGKRDRSTGAFGKIGQKPLPISISGNVFEDLNLDLRRDASDPLLANVVLELWKLNDKDTYASTGHMATTDQAGHYIFNESLELSPGVYQIRERQPVGYLSVGAIAGMRSDGKSTGATVPDNTDILTQVEVPTGGLHVVNLDFAEARPASLSGHVHAAGPNGDCVEDPEVATPIAGVRIELFNAVTNQFVVETVTNAQGIYTFDGLRPGTYRVVEHTPTGWLDGSDHIGTVDGRSVGRIVRNDEVDAIVLNSGSQGIDYDFCEVLPARLSGSVFHDRNLNGIRDVSEEGIANVEIQLFNDRDQLVSQTTTDSSGSYRFDNLEVGSYRIREIQPTAWLDGREQLGAVDGQPSGVIDGNDRFRDIRLPSNGTGANYNFGEFLPGSISGRVHSDPDQDCFVDHGELLLAGVRIELWSNGLLVSTTLTDEKGEYQFTNLAPGSYAVREIQPLDYFHGGQRAGTGGGLTNTADEVSAITLVSGQQATDYLFCELPPSEISGYVFKDGADVSLKAGESLPVDISLVRDGKRSDGDIPIAGVTLELRHGITGVPIASRAALPNTYRGDKVQVTTDAFGRYHFKGLPKGNYAVFQVHPGGYIDGVDTPGTTSGIAFNAGKLVPQSIREQLEVDPLNDGIVRIALPPGIHSRENNFSEIRVIRPEPRVPFVPFNPPPPTPIPPPAVNRNVELLPGQATRPLVPDVNLPRLENRMRRAVGYTWHLSVTNGGSPRQSADSQTSTVRSTAPVWQPVGLVKEADGNNEWLLFDTDSRSRIHRKIRFGSASSLPIAGDFNGDGTAEVGTYDHGHWFIDLNGNGVWDNDDLWARLGYRGDLPVVGDWDGDGKDDIGIFGRAWPGDPRALESEPGLPDGENQRDTQPKNIPPAETQATRGRRELQATALGLVRTDLIDHVFHYGVAGDAPITGDWNGDGIHSIGVFRRGEWRLDVDGDGRWTDADRLLKFGEARDVPVTGDWNGDGVDDIGVYSQGTFRLDGDANGILDARDIVIETGEPAGQPVVGDWNADGIDDVGVNVGRRPKAPLRQARK